MRDVSAFRDNFAKKNVRNLQKVPNRRLEGLLHHNHLLLRALNYRYCFQSVSVISPSAAPPSPSPRPTAAGPAAGGSAPGPRSRLGGYTGESIMKKLY